MDIQRISIFTGCLKLEKKADFDFYRNLKENREYSTNLYKKLRNCTKKLKNLYNKIVENYLTSPNFPIFAVVCHNNTQIGIRAIFPNNITYTKNLSLWNFSFYHFHITVWEFTTNVNFRCEIIQERNVKMMWANEIE